MADHKLFGYRLFSLKPESSHVGGVTNMEQTLPPNARQRTLRRAR